MNTLDKDYRYEIKFIIDNSEVPILKKKLSLFMKMDEHYDGAYFIRSVYYDDIYKSAYYEKIDGIKNRKKYRIRTYNYDKSYISLEIKGKDNMLSYKNNCLITYDEYNCLIKKDFNKIQVNDRELLSNFIFDLKTKNLVPMIVVDYTREAYTYESQDVRITFDSDVRAGNFNGDLFDNKIFTEKVFDDNSIILEVKFNDRIPTFINDIIKSTKLNKIQVSKFALCMERKGRYYDI